MSATVPTREDVLAVIDSRLAELAELAARYPEARMPRKRIDEWLDARLDMMADAD